MKNRKTILVLFIIYSVVMLWLLYGQRIGFVRYEDYLLQLKAKINLIPFRTVNEYIEMYNTNAHSLVRHAIINLGGNVGVFIPLGVFLPAIWEKLKRAISMFICSSAIIIAVEFIQYFTLLGSFDIDDYILNMIGIFMGFLLYKLDKKLTA
ncbi:MAG: VanZ family protein [Clostridia bacterium]|nr:VanZ family protein [Clostridia bacterium]